MCVGEKIQMRKRRGRERREEEKEGEEERKRGRKKGVLKEWVCGEGRVADEKREKRERREHFSLI